MCLLQLNIDFIFISQPDYDDEIERKSKPFFSRSNSKTTDKNRKKYSELWLQIIKYRNNINI